MFLKAYRVAKKIEQNFPGIRVRITHDKRIIPPAMIITGYIPLVVKFDVRITDTEWDNATVKQLVESFSDRLTAILREKYSGMARRRN